MYEDPQDVFRDTDELFAHLYARMTRDFAAGELKGIRLPQDPAAWWRLITGTLFTARPVSGRL